MKNNIQLTREEFEASITQKLQQAVDQAKQIRETLRNLETSVATKEEHIQNFQNIFSKMQTQLVKLQSTLYAKGTT